jgi:hypothetical protein
MAIKDIEQMTAPLSRKGETQMAMSDAPEDYLKRAVEQFIIDFPEFEDLQGQDLYDKMEEKGYFSDRYAMSDPDPMDMRHDMMENIANEYFGKSLKDLTDDEILQIEENFDEFISQRKQPKGIMQLASGLDIQALSLDELQLKIDALNWAMKTLGRNSWAEVLEDSDMQGVLNAYQDAGGMD